MKYKRIKSVRKQKGISIKQMSQLLDISSFKYWYLELHVDKMECAIFIRICHLLGINIEFKVLWLWFKPSMKQK